MNLSDLQQLCKKAYCRVCFERFEALNDAVAPELLDHPSSSDALLQNLNAKNLFDKGRKLLFCLKCKLTVHSGCYRPETSFPVEIKLRQGKAVTLEYFECSRCLSSSVPSECSLCGIHKGLTVPLAVVRKGDSFPSSQLPRKVPGSPADDFVGSAELENSQSDPAVVRHVQRNEQTEMEIEESEQPSDGRLLAKEEAVTFANLPEEARCHVLCGLANNGVYHSLSRVELDPALANQKLERKCLICDLPLLHGFSKCSDCNLHLHLHCMLTENVEKALEENIDKGDKRLLKVQTVKKPFTINGFQLANHGNFSPEKYMSESLASVFESVAQLHFISPTDLREVFAKAISKKIGHYNTAFSTNYSIEFRCKHHVQSKDEQQQQQKRGPKCQNCSDKVDSDTLQDRVSPNDKVICTKCLTLKQISSFETKKDFEKAASDLQTLSTHPFSIHDEFFLGKLFFDRLVFILPHNQPGLDFLRGFKMVKKRLVDQLTLEFIDKLFKELGTHTIQTTLDTNSGLFSLEGTVERLDLILSGLQHTNRLLLDDLKKPAAELAEKLTFLVNRLRCATDGKKSLKKILKKLTKVTIMHELAGSSFLQRCVDAAEVLEDCEKRFADFLDPLLGESDADPFCYLRVKDFAAQFLESHSEQVDNNPVLAHLLLNFLWQHEFIPSFFDCSTELRTHLLPPCQTLLKFVRAAPFDAAVPNLRDFALFALPHSDCFTDSANYQLVFNRQNAKVLAGFQTAASRILATLQPSKLKRASLMKSLTQNGLVLTCHHVSEFLNNFVFLRRTPTYKKIETINQKSHKVNQIFHKNLNLILQDFAVKAPSLSQQLKILQKILDDYFDVVGQHNSFVDTDFITMENVVAELNYVLSFLEGKKVSQEKLLSILSKVKSVADRPTNRSPVAVRTSMEVDETSFEIWQRAFLPQFEEQIASQASHKMKGVLDFYERFKERVFAAFSSSEREEYPLLVSEVTEGLETLANFPFKHFDSDIEYFGQLTTFFDAIKRSLPGGLNVQDWRVRDLLDHLISADKWVESFRKHNRMERLATIVGFLTQFRTRSPSVETFLRPVLRLVLERKLESLSSEKFYSLEKIAEFNQLLSFCQDQLFLSRVSEFKVFKVYSALLGGLKSLFGDHLNLSNFLMFAAADTLKKISETVRQFSVVSNAAEPPTKEADDSLVWEEDHNINSVRFFIKNLGDFLERAKKFERSPNIEPLLSFLETCQKKAISLNVLIVLVEGNGDIWSKVAAKYETDFERLPTHIADVAEIKSLIKSREIEELLHKTEQFMEVHLSATSLVHRFSQKQVFLSDEAETPTNKLVCASELKRVKERMKLFKGLMTAKYAEVKKILQFIEAFENNLALEVETLCDLCLEVANPSKKAHDEGTETAVWQRTTEKQLEQTFLALGPSEVPKTSAFKNLRSKYFETRKLYHSKSFKSDTTSFNLSYYKALYELYKMLTLPKSLEELEAFLSKEDFSTFREASEEREVLKVLREVHHLFTSVFSNESYVIDELVVQRMAELRSVLFLGSLRTNTPEQTRKVAGLFALRFLCFDLRDFPRSLKSFQLKTAAFAVLESGLMLSGSLSAVVFAPLLVEARLIKLISVHRVSERFVVRFAIEQYVQHLDFESTELEDLTSNYLAQTDRFLAVRHRIFSTIFLPEQSLSTEQILSSFGNNEITAKKTEKLKALCNRTSVTRFALVAQLTGHGNFNPLNVSIQTLLDANEFLPDFEVIFQKLSAERNKGVELTADTLLFNRSVRSKPTDRAVISAFVELRMLDQVDSYLVLSTQLALVLHVYCCLTHETIVVKIKELRVYFAEIKNLVIACEKFSVPEPLLAQIRRILRTCWNKAAEIIRETERYVASLSSISIVVETVFKFRSVVSTSDMIEGIHEVNSKLVDSLDPFGLEQPPEEPADAKSLTEQFLEIEEQLVGLNDRAFELFRTSASLELTQTEIDLQGKILEEVGLYQRELRLKMEAKKAVEPIPIYEHRPAPKKEKAETHFSPISAESRSDHAKRKRSDFEKAALTAPSHVILNNLNNPPAFEAEKSDFQDNYFEISDDQKSSSGPQVRSHRLGGTLETFLGQTSYWKRFQKAVRANPHYKEAQNALNLTGFSKKLENNFKNLRFLFTQLAEDEIEAFLQSYKHINSLIEKYNTQRLTYQDVVDLIQNPHTRLKSSKEKRKKEKPSSKGKSSMITEIYQDLDKQEIDESAPRKEEAPLPSKEEPETKTDDLLAKREGPSKDEQETNFFNAIEIKRIKPVVTQINPVTLLSRLTSALIAKVYFFDDKTSASDKVAVPDVRFYCAESRNLLAAFPDFKKQFKFRSSEFKKHIQELQRDYFLRQATRNNLIAGFCFLPVNKLQNNFCLEFEKGFVGGYACAPNLHIYIAHFSMLHPEFFRSLNLYFADEENTPFANLFVFFLKKVDSPMEAEKEPLQFEKIFESDDSNFEETQKRKAEIVETHFRYFCAYEKAKYFKIQPQIYFKMGSEVLNLKEELLHATGADGSQSKVPALQEGKVPQNFNPSLFAPALPVQFPPGFLMPDPRLVPQGQAPLPYMMPPMGPGYPPMYFPPPNMLPNDPNYQNYMQYYPPQQFAFNGPLDLSFQSQQPVLPSGIVNQQRDAIRGEFQQPSHRHPPTGLNHGEGNNKTSHHQPQNQPPIPSLISDRPKFGGLFNFENATGTLPLPARVLPESSNEIRDPTAAANGLSPDELEIKEMIEDLDLNELTEIYQEADQALKDTITKVMGIIRSNEVTAFLNLVGNK